MYTNKKWLIKKLYKGISQRKIAEYSKTSLYNIEKQIRVFNLKGLKKEGKKVYRLSYFNIYLCYFIGLFLTDGYYHDNGIISITQKKSKKDLMKLLAEKLKLNIYYNSKKETYEICSSLSWALAFSDLTSIKPGAKTFTASFNNFYKLPSMLQTFVVRGMIDGDGCIRQNGQIRFYSESNDLLNIVKYYYNRNGIDYSISGKELYVLSTSRLKAGILLYSKIPDLSVSRNKTIIDRLVNDIVQTYSIVKSKNYEIKSS